MSTLWLGYVSINAPARDSSDLHANLDYEYEAAVLIETVSCICKKLENM